MTSVNEASKIRNTDGVKQVIDFRGLGIDDKKVYPTDIDGFIEWKDEAIVLFEVKHIMAGVPVGQQLALERVCKDMAVAQKRAVAFIVDQDTNNTSEAIVAATCNVRAVYDVAEGRWRSPKSGTNLRHAIKEFIYNNKLV